MKIGVFGAGYVGLVTGIGLAEMGNHVVIVDRDADKIAVLNSGRSPQYEPGIDELLVRNRKNDRLAFSGDAADAVKDREVVFLAVGTPLNGDGSASLNDLDAAVSQVVDNIDGYRLIVIKSTVPPGTTHRVEALFRSRVRHPVDVVSNPEFLKEGDAVKDFLHPDRVIVGARSDRARNIMRRIYEAFFRTGHRMMETDPESAEMIKYAANAMLAARISLMNELSGICQVIGADIESVRVGVGLDKRLGPSFLFAGMGYGGSCFPKDVRSLAHFAESVGARADMCRAIDATNRRQGDFLLPFVAKEFGVDLSGLAFAVWGLSYKPRTDDVRNSPALGLAEKLIAMGAVVRGFDPEAVDNARRALPALEAAENGYEALDGADALFVCTEWNEFRSPDWDEMRRRLRRPLIFDGRNIYNPGDMAGRGFSYYSIGRPPAFPGMREVNTDNA